MSQSIKKAVPGARAGKSLAALAALFAIAVAHPASLDAATIVPMTLTEIADRAEDIVHGQVVSAEAEWNEDRTLIVTNVRVRIFDALKGDAGGEVTFVHPGGVVGALRVEIPGIGSFRPEQESVLFLARDASGGRHVAGGIQGRFDVVTDPESGRKSVRVPAKPGVSELAADREPPSAQTAPRRGADELVLDEFLQRVRDLANGQEVQPR